MGDWQGSSAAGALNNKQKLWLPAGAIDETIPRALLQNTQLLASGSLALFGGAVIPAGQKVTNVAFAFATAATSPTNAWFCLVRPSDRAVLAKTSDNGAGAIGANTVLSLPLATPYTPTTDEPVYLGAVVVATGMPALASFNPARQPVSLIAGTSTTGLTDPSSLGATAAALVALNAIAYGYLS